MVTPTGGVHVHDSGVTNLTTMSPEPSDASVVTGLAHVVAPLVDELYRMITTPEPPFAPV